PVSSRDPWLLMARWQMPGTHALLFRRSAITTVGGWKPDQPCCQEHELLLRLLIAGKRFVFSPSAGAIYRHWSSSTISTKDPLQTLTKRLELADAAEDHLVRTGTLTELYRDAFAFQRIECARIVYPRNPSIAIGIAERAKRVH